LEFRFGIGLGLGFGIGLGIGFGIGLGIGFGIGVGFGFGIGQGKNKDEQGKIYIPALFWETYIYKNKAKKKYKKLVDKNKKNV